MIDLRAIAYDVCRCYTLDLDGLVDPSFQQRVLGWIRSRDLERLSSCPDHIPEALQHRDLTLYTRQIAAFFKKNPAFSDSLRCDSEARTAFRTAEMQCRITNKRLDHYYVHANRLGVQRRSDINRAKRIIRDTLGEFADFVEELPHLIRVTSGATSTRSRRNSLPYLKVRKRGLPATSRAQPYLDALSRFFGYGRVSYKTVQTNRVETVPKSWKTNRTIACEPEGNLSLQLALDSYIKTRLRKKMGIDLSDQGRNQRLAKEGSMDDNLSTIDLSMASDTMAYNTVSWLLPSDWFEFADRVRTPLGVGFGEVWKYAKFSSMGNGATFTLETLIFASLCKAIGSHRFSVYGDDIIIETEFSERLISLLRFFGFHVNKAKSYTSGPFRESCGADWFRGVNVTPFYLRPVSSTKAELSHIVNGLIDISLVEGHLMKFCKELVAQASLPLVPFNSSSISGVWITPHHAYSQRLIQTRHWGPYKQGPYSKFKAFLPRTKSRVVADSRSLFLWHLDAYRRSFGIKPSLDRNPYLNPERMGKEIASDCITRSSVPVFTHKYVRKWVIWRMPDTASPDLLFLWSDYLLRSDAE